MKAQGILHPSDPSLGGGEGPDDQGERPTRLRRQVPGEVPERSPPPDQRFVPLHEADPARGRLVRVRAPSGSARQGGTTGGCHRVLGPSVCVLGVRVR